MTCIDAPSDYTDTVVRRTSVHIGVRRSPRAEHPELSALAHLNSEEVAEIARRESRDVLRRHRIPGVDHDDVVQELYVRLVGSFDSFDTARGRIGAFATTVSRNHSRSLVRRSKAVKRKPDATAASLEAVSDSAAEPAADRRRPDQPSWHEACEQLDLAIDLEALMSSLASEPKLLSTARLVMEMTPTEAAPLLDVSRGTVYRRLDRIRLLASDELRQYL